MSPMKLVNLKNKDVQVKSDLKKNDIIYFS